jgi:indolepyruvate ferredoxin oxidoreductase
MNAPLTPAQELALHNVTLDDKYTLENGRAWMSGIHALVRLPMLQQQRDARAGLNTAGFISGPATAARRWAAWTRTCGRPGNT